MEDVQENQPITLDLKPKEPQPQDLNFQTVWVETVPKFKITSVAFHSTQKISNLYVGTSDGTISLYQFKLHKQKENVNFVVSCSHKIKQSGGHAFAAPCYLSCGTNVGKSSVLNLVIIESYDHIAALCDGKLHMLKLKNLKLTTTLRIPAGIQGYAFQTFPKESESHEQASNNKLCFYIKTTLYLYDLDLGTTYKQLYLPEVPTDIVWIQNSIIVGLSKECSKIDLSRNCQVEQLWATSTNRIKALPSGEVIICSASANKAVLVDVRDHQISTTLPSIPNTHIGYVFPYVVFAKEKSIHIYDRFVPGRDQEIAFNECTFLVDGGDMCVIVNKQNEISVLVQNTMNYQCVNEDVLPIISKHSFDELVLTQFFKKFLMTVNPFGALIDYFVQKIYSKYYTSLASTNIKNIDTIIKSGIKPDITHYTIAVHRTMYEYLVGSIKLEDSSLETFEEISKSSIYEYIFGKMYSQLLFPLYCKLYATEDKVYMSNTVKLKDIPKKTLGLKKKYWLTKDSLKENRRKSELPKIAPSKLFSAKYANPFNSQFREVSVHSKNEIVYIIEGEREIKRLSIDKLYFNKALNSILFQEDSQIGKIDFDAETFINFKKEMKKGSVLFEEPVTEKPSEETEPHSEEDAERIRFLEREDYIPYQAAMEKLRTSSKYSTMQDKLECILATIQDTVQAVKEFWQAASSKKNVLIGADDLLPILVYVVLKAEVPNVHAEVNCLLDFIEEKTMSGQLGYSLCTLKSVLMALEATPGADKSSEVSAVPETPTVSTASTPSTSDLDFVKRFKLPEGQYPITYFNCGYLFATGKLYICPNYLCFEAGLIFPVQNVVIPYTDIVGTEKTTTLALIPTAVEVTKTNGEKYKFVGLINRNEVYDAIQNQMKSAGVVTTTK